MSNYKTSLQTNNTSIQALISKAQALPLASGETLVDNSYNENAIVGRAIRQYSNSRITELRSGAFAGCATLKSINLPKVSKAGAIAFAACGKLAKASLPQMEHLDNQAFLHCTSLTELSFPKISFIGSQAFSSCHWLSSLTITTGGEPCTLEHSDAFTDTPFAGYSEGFGGTPHIYVRESLVDVYKSAANWSYFSSYFSAIITFIIDGVEYQAEKGMTWSEWVESEYNKHPTLGILANNGVGCTKCGKEIWTIIDSAITDEGWFKGSDVIGAHRVNNYSLSHSCDIITFTINSLEYQAKEGMTWGEWIESGYNTIGIKIREDGYVANSNDIAIVTDEDNIWELTATDAIIADFGYLTSAWH